MVAEAEVTLLLCRFGRDDMVHLCSALQRPERYTCSQGISATCRNGSNDDYASAAVIF